MNLLALGALGVILGYAMLSNAGVPLTEWHWCLITLGLVAALYFAFPRRNTVPPLDRLTAIASGSILFLAVLQLVPLPVALMKLLSPARVELLNATSPVLPSKAQFIPLTATTYETTGIVLSLAAYLLIFLLIRDLRLRYSEHPWSAVWPLLVIGTLEAGLGFYQAYTEGTGGLATGTFANRDHFAGFVEMVLPFAAMYPIAVLQRDRKRHESPAGPALQACGLLAIAAVLLIGIIHSLSRMGFLAALAALFVGGATALSLSGWRVEYKVRIPVWRRWLPSGIVGLIVILGFIFLPTDPLIARFSDLARTEDISADTRAQIWRDTVGLIKSYPLFGCGLGAYGSAFLRFKSVAPMSTVDYAHNDYLQVLAEMGVLGFLAGLLFIGRALQRTVRGAIYARSIDERYLAIACTASMTAMLLHSFVDFNMYVPANALVFAWVVGIAGVHLRQRPAAT